RADVLDREPDRARLEWRELRRTAEHVAVQLLLDADDVAVVLRVHRIAPSAEVHEVQEREVVLELLDRDREPSGDLVGRERRRALVSTRREQMREERLQHAEPLRRDRTDRALGKRLPRVGSLGAGDGRSLAVVIGLEDAKGVVDGLDQLVPLERDRTTVLAEDPARE